MHRVASIIISFLSLSVTVINPQNMRILLSYLVPSIVALSSAGSLFAELPTIPVAPIATKGELLFSDNFDSAELKKPWRTAIATFAVENGALKGTQTRDKDIPAEEGKPGQKAHPAIEGLAIPTKDSVLEVKINFEGATMLDVEFDDRKYTGSVYGHICRAQVRLNSVTIIDERDGGMNLELGAMRKDPATKAEADKRMVGRSVTFPVKLEASKWYTLQIETVGDAMRVSIDGAAVGYLKSSGIGHDTKSQIELGCSGKDGFFDEIKVWTATPAAN